MRQIHQHQVKWINEIEGLSAVDFVYSFYLVLVGLCYWERRYVSSTAVNLTCCMCAVPHTGIGILASLFPIH
jgi:hypothetical protein